MSETHDVTEQTFDDIILLLDKLTETLERDPEIDETHRFAVRELLEYYKSETKTARHHICALSQVPPLR
jgi:hypothetical protein